MSSNTFKRSFANFKFNPGFLESSTQTVAMLTVAMGHIDVVELLDNKRRFTLVYTRTSLFWRRSQIN